MSSLSTLRRFLLPPNPTQYRDIHITKDWCSSAGLQDVVIALYLRRVHICDALGSSSNHPEDTSRHEDGRFASCIHSNTQNHTTLPGGNVFVHLPGSCIQNHPSSQTKGDHYIITSFKALNCSNGLFFVQSNLQLKTMS